MSKIMKRIFIGLSAIVAIAMGLSGCDSDRTTYSGPEYVMFSIALLALSSISIPNVRS